MSSECDCPACQLADAIERCREEGIHPSRLIDFMMSRVAASYPEFDVVVAEVPIDDAPTMH